ncbi:hypothetical protein GDO81_016770 [Engystomops pustulosus]|uniref:Uncharacterized protein n=1 Tax=Engystomops pustulosus TaxID=76066 RepID=A0AAV7ADB7_ENGPU|nr:hypothetical protein GDO81_016770 [Engystomops pustulosus]
MVHVQTGQEGLIKNPGTGRTDGIGSEALVRTNGMCLETGIQVKVGAGSTSRELETRHKTGKMVHVQTEQVELVQS